MNCSVDELFPTFAPNTSTDSILKKLRLSLAQLNKLSTQLTLTQPQASLIVSNLSHLIRDNETHKDIIIVSFLLMQKILCFVSESTQEFLSNFILISTHFGFQRTQYLLNITYTPTLKFSCRSNPNLFIKLIFLREFITGKDKTILKIFFSPSFEKSIIYQFFFAQLLILSNDANFPNCIRIFCHALIQWLDTAMLFFKHTSYDSSVNNDVFSYKRTIARFIFKFVWKFIEEPSPGISENARIILQKYIRLHAKFSFWSNQDPTPFHRYLLTRTLDIPWTSKARYILLRVITGHVPSETMTSTHGQLPGQLSRCLATTSLYSPAYDLYKALITGISIQDWTQLWLAPFMKSLLSSDQSERDHLTLYWLPSTLKLIPKSSELILTSIIDIANCTNSSHSRFLTPLHNGNFNSGGINLMPHNDSILYAITLWIKYSTTLDLFRLTEACTDILREGLSCGDEFVRIEALHVVLTSAFDCAQVWRLALIHEFIPLNLNPSSTPFRQKLSVIMYKSIACVQSLLIEGLPSDSSAESVASFELKYDSFIRILCLFKSKSLQCLWPDSPFQKVSLGLFIYQSLLDSFVCPIETKKSNSKSRESKLRLYSILCNLDFELLTLSDLVPVCLCLTSDYFEIRELAFHIIAPHLTIESVSQAVRRAFPDGLSVRGRCLLTSSRVYDGETGAMLLKLHLKSEVDNSKGASPANQMYMLCTDLISELSRQFVSARKDILEAAHHAPLFSTITAISYILSIALPGMEQEGIDWQGFLVDLIALLNDIIAFSLSTLGDSENEDMLAPSFADMGVAIESAVLATQSTNNTSSHADCSSVSYQFVMNCVWLALRESNALLGALSGLPIINSALVGDGMLVLTPELVDKIGSILITILTKCRHVGALLSCQVALIKFCSNISCCVISSVGSLRSKWLHEIINTITSHDKKSSISRQGAGLPLCVQSILTSESKHPRKPLLHHAMHLLFLHACNTEPLTAAGDATGTHDLVAVRCTNVLRALFRDSTIGNECVLSYGEKGLALAVSSMRSPIWSVRNAGMMLFGALAVKMLGQRRLSEENSELNCITMKQFFIRFPSSRFLLLSQLQSPPDCASTNLHAAVYPVLLLLSKLCPSPHYAFSEKLGYIRTLQCYVHSPVHSVRCKASQALTTFLYKPNMDTILLHLLDKIPTSNARSISSNVLHGQLILISELLKAAYVTYGNGCTDSLPAIQKLVMSICWLLGKVVPLSINKVYFSLIRMLKDCDLAHNSVFEINYEIFSTLSQHSFTDSCIIDFILSIIEYFQSCLHRTNEIFHQTFCKFTAEFLLSFMEPPNSSIIHLSTSLLEYPNSIQWLTNHMNSVFLNLINCFIQLTTSPVIPIDSLTFLLEVIAQMLEVAEFDRTLIKAIDSLVDTLLLPNSDLTIQLCSMQMSGIILTWKLAYQDVVVRREDEMEMLWVDLVRNHSRPDSSEDSRMACVISLVRIFTRLPLSQYVHTFLIECVDVVIMLLQDEVAEVRTALANGLATTLYATSPLQPHIALKLLFQSVATNWCRHKQAWDVLLGFITARITMNDPTVQDEIVLFEKGKDNIFGEDCFNFEFALKSLCSISQKLEVTELKEEFIQCLYKCLEKELHSLPEITQLNTLDSLLRKDALLFKRISGIFCLSELLSVLGREKPVNETILQLNVHSCILSLAFKLIEEWIQEM